jgi:hypothetical protein
VELATVRIERDKQRQQLEQLTQEQRNPVIERATYETQSNIGTIADWKFV